MLAPERPGAYLHKEHAPGQQSSARQPGDTWDSRRSMSEFERLRVPGGRQNSAYPLASNPPTQPRPNPTNFEEAQEPQAVNLEAYIQWHIRKSPAEKRAFLRALKVLENKAYDLTGIAQLRHLDWLKLELNASL
ncbi:MAG: hypothetical protein M1829_001338, partial [Trizodia sp. TS-e1964]